MELSFLSCLGSWASINYNWNNGLYRWQWLD